MASWIITLSDPQVTFKWHRLRFQIKPHLAPWSGMFFHWTKALAFFEGVRWNPPRRGLDRFPRIFNGSQLSKPGRSNFDAKLSALEKHIVYLLYLLYLLSILDPQSRCLKKNTYFHWRFASASKSIKVDLSATDLRFLRPTMFSCHRWIFLSPMYLTLGTTVGLYSGVFTLTMGSSSK